MLSLLFHILKIFLIVILLLLAISILFVILALIIPVKFKIKAKYEQKFNINFKLKFLLGINYCFNNFQNLENPIQTIKIFGIDLKKLKKIFCFKLKNKKVFKEDIDKFDKKLENNINKENINNKPQENNHKSNNEKHNYKNQKSSKKSTHKSIEKENSTKNKTSLIYKIRQYKKFVNQDIIKEIFYFLKKLFKTIKIKNLKAYLEYDLNDPFLTGCTLGIASIILPFIPYDIKISSNFNEEDIKLDVDFEGRISLFKLILYTSLFISKKSIRKIIFYKGDLGDE